MRFLHFHVQVMFKKLFRLIFINFILVGCILLRYVYVYLSNIPAIATEDLLVLLLFSLFTTCFGPSGEIQLHHLHILRKPSILQRICCFTICLLLSTLWYIQWQMSFYFNCTHAKEKFHSSAKYVHDIFFKLKYNVSHNMLVISISYWGLLAHNLRAGNPLLTACNLNLSEGASSGCSTVPNCIHMKGHAGIALELWIEKR
jgi:hypothetical protein